MRPRLTSGNTQPTVKPSAEGGESGVVSGYIADRSHIRFTRFEGDARRAAVDGYEALLLDKSFAIGKIYCVKPQVSVVSRDQASRRPQNRTA